MACFHVFFFNDVIEIGQLEKQAIHRINGYFDVTVSRHFDSQFRSHFKMSRETVEVLTKIIGNCRRDLHKKSRLEMLRYLNKRPCMPYSHCKLNVSVNSKPDHPPWGFTRSYCPGVGFLPNFFARGVGVLNSRNFLQF